MEDASSKSTFMMKKDSVFVVCFRFSKFFHLTKLFKLLEFFKFSCFNLAKGNTNLHVHDFTFSKKKKLLLPLVTFILMRQICFSEKLSISKSQHCAATLRYGKQITLTKGTHHRKYIFAVKVLNGNWNFLYFMGIKLHMVHDITLVAEEIKNLNHLYSLNTAT